MHAWLVVSALAAVHGHCILNTQNQASAEFKEHHNIMQCYTNYGKDMRKAVIIIYVYFI